MFAYRLVSGHWRVQTGVAHIGEAGTVTTARVFGLNVLTGWEQHRLEWADVAWLAMRVHVGRQQKMGVGVDVIDVEEDEPPPPRASAKGAPKGTRPPPPPKPRVRPSRRSGQCGRSRRSRWGGGGRGGWCRSGWTNSGRGLGRHAP